jgi:hypothetical protein
MYAGVSGDDTGATTGVSCTTISGAGAGPGAASVSPVEVAGVVDVGTSGQKTARTDRNVLRPRRRRRELILAAAAFRRLRKRKALMESAADTGTRNSRVSARRHGARMPHVTQEGGL